VIAASGTLAQIIPPSLVLIVLADQLGKSVGDLYKGAFIPGFTLTGLYVLYVIGVAIIRPNWVPALPKEARTIREPDGTPGLRSLGVWWCCRWAWRSRSRSRVRRGADRRADRHVDVRRRRHRLRPGADQQGHESFTCCRRWQSASPSS
jgi:TRAP-type mannitol/chloroaromatic compound transport system permease large subunit